ncbi:hypothetical protein [Roseomonas marmotae]|uniref:Uncharacterized protein n=1 Tax=Roseomonas marmotae TaxID=2768161 RepID=A0ABS3KAI5_9PROT|nr:hypothetical protein [Roseomonas marmotae]MBO1073371.1 hypothetical protein [Roseomonas marmotae]
MSGMMSCAAAIKSAASGLSDDDVEEVITAMVRRERGKPSRAGDLLRWREAAREQSAEEIARAANERRARQIDLVRRTAREARYAANPDTVQAVSDLLTTSQRAGAGRALSTEAMQREAFEGLRGPFVAELQKVGGLPILRHLDAETERDLVREIARLNGAEGVAATSDPRIRDIALVIAKHGEKLRQELNAAGADIGHQPGYVTRQSHDQRRVRGDASPAAFQAWRDATFPLLHERTFIDSHVDPADGAAVEQFLRNVWSNLATGNHHVAAPGAEVNPLSGFKGPGNLARRLSEDRVLHFRGPDEWLAYNRQFGSQNLVGAVMSAFDHGGKALGLLQMWGTNPEAAFRGDLQRLADRMRDSGDIKGALALQQASGERAKLTREWRVVSGDADRPGNVTAAQVMATVNTLETVSRLGGVVISSITDLPVNAATLRHEGISYWAHLGRATASLLEGTPQGVRGEVAMRLSAGLNGLLGGLHQRMGYSDAVPGALARGADLFFKLNLQTYWQDALERATSLTLAAHVGESLPRAWAELEPRFRTGMERYGVTEADWRLMQQAELLRDTTGGPAYFTPDMLEGLGDDAAAARAARQRIGAWFTSTSDAAMTRPGAYEKSILTLGEAPGTVLGETLRLLTKFRSYPLSYVTRHWTREWDRAQSVPEALGNIGGLIAATTTLGYVAMTLKDLARGRNPREPEDAMGWAKLVGAAMTQGGGAGIFGDFLFAEYSRFGSSGLATVAGPTISSVESLLRFYATAVRGGAAAALGDDVHGNLGAQAVNLGLREVLPRALGFVPGGVLLNTFYGKFGLEYLVTHQLQEAVNPGYLDRMQRRLERENNQTMWLEP